MIAGAGYHSCQYGNSNVQPVRCDGLLRVATARLLQRRDENALRKEGFPGMTKGCLTPKVSGGVYPGPDIWHYVAHVLSILDDVVSGGARSAQSARVAVVFPNLGRSSGRLVESAPIEHLAPGRSDNLLAARHTHLMRQAGRRGRIDGSRPRGHMYPALAARCGRRCPARLSTPKLRQFRTVRD